MAPSASECKEAQPFNFKYLPPHQMNDIRRNKLHVSPLPLFHRISLQKIIIFVVPIHPQGCKWFVRQPLSPVFLFARFIPRIQNHRQIITKSSFVRIYFLLLRKYIRTKTAVIAMTVSSYINPPRFPLPFLLCILPLSTYQSALRDSFHSASILYQKRFS